MHREGTVDGKAFTEDMSGFGWWAYEHKMEGGQKGDTWWCDGGPIRQEPGEGERTLVSAGAS
jgi:hypothetical protein